MSLWSLWRIDVFGEKRYFPANRPYLGMLSQNSIISGSVWYSLSLNYHRKRIEFWSFNEFQKPFNPKFYPTTY